MSEPRKLKRVVIKEELFALTGDFKEAIILNQFIYWSERIRDFDKFVEEENKRMQMETGEEPIDLNNGWIFKSVKELKEEIMINLSESNLSKYINNLVEKEFLSKRRNPKYKWDKTFQYRVNLKYIQISLNKLGYCLEGYKDSRFSRISVLENGNSVLDNHNLQNRRAIPEITTEITTEIINTDFYKKSQYAFYDNCKHFLSSIKITDENSISDYTENIEFAYKTLEYFYHQFYNKLGYRITKLTEEQEKFVSEKISDNLDSFADETFGYYWVDLYLKEKRSKNHKDKDKKYYSLIQFIKGLNFEVMANKANINGLNIDDFKLIKQIS